MTPQQMVTWHALVASARALVVAIVMFMCAMMHSCRMITTTDARAVRTYWRVPRHQHKSVHASVVNIRCWQAPADVHWCCNWIPPPLDSTVLFIMLNAE